MEVKSYKFDIQWREALVIIIALTISIGLGVFNFISLFIANLSDSMRGALQVIVLTSGGIFLRYFLSFKYHK
jgi:hypothetical protein